MTLITQLFEEYKERVADIHLYQRAAYRLMHAELQELKIATDSSAREHEVRKYRQVFVL